MKKILLFFIGCLFALTSYSQIIPSTPVYGSLSVYKKLAVADTSFLNGNVVMDSNLTVAQTIESDSGYVARLQADSLDALWCIIDSAHLYYTEIDSLYVGFVDADSVYSMYGFIDTISGNSVDFNKVVGNFVTVDTTLIIRLLPTYSSDTFAVMQNDSIGIHIGIHYADSAGLAGTADTSFVSGVADTSFLSGTADTSFVSGVADTAFLAGTADTSFVSGVADTAFVSGVADTAFLAGTADTSFVSGVSDSVTTVNKFFIDGLLIQGVSDTITILAADTLLPIGNYSIILIQATGATDIDTIDSGVPDGTVIEIWGTDTDVTINDGMNINLAGGVLFNFGVGDVMVLRYVLGEFYEISRSDN